mgnify:FL=1
MLHGLFAKFLMRHAESTAEVDRDLFGAPILLPKPYQSLILLVVNSPKSFSDRYPV